MTLKYEKITKQVEVQAPYVEALCQCGDSECKVCVVICEQDDAEGEFGVNFSEVGSDEAQRKIILSRDDLRFLAQDIIHLLNRTAPNKKWIETGKFDANTFGRVDGDGLTVR